MVIVGVRDLCVGHGGATQLASAVRIRRSATCVWRIGGSVCCAIPHVLGLRAVAATKNHKKATTANTNSTQAKSESQSLMKRQTHTRLSRRLYYEFITFLFG